MGRWERDGSNPPFLTPAPGPRGLSPGIRYEAWPLVIHDETTGELLGIYSTGTQHLYTSGRKVVERSLVGLEWDAWSDEATVYDSGNDDSTYSIGQDSTGRPLCWILERTSADLDTGTGSKVLRRRDSGTWSTIATIATGSPKIRFASPIVNLANGDLLCAWQGINDGSSEWGVLISADDGTTWSQHTIESALGLADWPVEIRFVVLADGALLGIGRTENVGDELFQLVCDGADDPSLPASWSRASTNIADQDRTPSALVLRDDVVDLYYYDRTNGILRYRTTAVATILSSPTSWPASSALVTGGGTDADGGYPHAIADPANPTDRNLVVFYSGNSAICRVFLLPHEVT